MNRNEITDLKKQILALNERMETYKNTKETVQ